MTPKLDRLLVGTDFSVASVAAARWAVRHLAPEAETTLLHAVAPVPRPAYAAAYLETPEEILARSMEHAEERLERMAKSVAGERPVEVEIRVGEPVETLARAAADLDADAVVVGEHGQRPGAWDLLGSTAERLLHGSGRPVVVAKHPPEAPPRSIVAAVDDSELTGPILRWTRHLRKTFGARVAVTHAVTPALHAHLRLVTSESEARKREEEVRDEAYRWLRRALEEAGFEPEESSTPPVLHIASGHPAYEVLAAARRHEGDLIVMGSRGAGAAGRALLGSVAASVLRGSPCPVFVVDRPGS